MRLSRGSTPYRVLGVLFTVILVLAITPGLTGDIVAQGQQPARTNTPRPSSTPLDTPVPTPLVRAQPTTVGAGPLLAQDIPMQQFGLTNQELVSPLQTARYNFSLPTNWDPVGNNVLNLVIDFSTAGPSQPVATNRNLDAILVIRFNGTLAASITLPSNTTENTNRVIKIPMPYPRLNQDRRFNNVEITLDSREQCLEDYATRVLIKADQSFFHFEYRETSTPRDLALYPQPLFTHQIRPQNDISTIVLPDAFTETDLKAASALAAGMGQLSDNRVQFRVATESTLTDEERKSFDLILIGQIGKHATIDALYKAATLPTKLSTDGKLTVNNTAVADTDGVIQLVPNPDNALKSILLLTGKSPEGVLKAAYALSGPPSLIGLSGAVAIVADVLPQVAKGVGLENSFAALGYVDQYLAAGPSVTNATRITVNFALPVNASVGTGAVVDLDYDISDALGKLPGTLTVALNDTPVTTFTLNNLQSIPTPADRRVRIPLPVTLFRSGEVNRLTFSIDTRPTLEDDWRCNIGDPTLYWLLLRASSKLTLPLEEIAPESIRLPLVSNLPAPFTSVLPLTDTLFSLPPKPSLGEVSQLIRISSYLSATGFSTGRFTPEVRVGQVRSDIDRGRYHFIVIGLPNTNPFLAELNDSLLQSFDIVSNELIQGIDGVIYRLPASYNVGVLQILPSPWSASRVVFVITGTSAEGQGLAASLLLSESYDPTSFDGNVVLFNPPSLSIINAPLASAVSGTPVPLATRSKGSTATSTAVPTASLAPSTTPTQTPIVPTRIPAATVTPIPTATPIPTEARW